MTIYAFSKNFCAIHCVNLFYVTYFVNLSCMRPCLPINDAKSFNCRLTIIFIYNQNYNKFHSLFFTYSTSHDTKICSNECLISINWNSKNAITHDHN